MSDCLITLSLKTPQSGRECFIISTIDMQIDFHSNLRKITGQRSINLSIADGSSILTVLNLLVHRYPEFKIIFFDQDGSFSAQMPVFINGRNPRLLPDGLQTKVSDEDVMSLFTPIASGKINVERISRALALEDKPKEDRNEN